MPQKLLLAAAMFAFLLGSAPVFAMSVEDGPTDTNGSQLTDPDEQMDGMAEQDSNGPTLVQWMRSNDSDQY